MRLPARLSAPNTRHRLPLMSIFSGRKSDGEPSVGRCRRRGGTRTGRRRGYFKEKTKRNYAVAEKNKPKGRRPSYFRILAHRQSFPRPAAAAAAAAAAATAAAAAAAASGVTGAVTVADAERTALDLILVSGESKTTECNDRAHLALSQIGRSFESACRALFFPSLRVPFS